MTLKDQMESDVASVFLDTDAHADSIIMQRSGRPPVTIAGIVDHQSHDIQSTSRGLDTPVTALLYIATDNGHDHDTKFKIGSKWYVVDLGRGGIQSDQRGMDTVAIRSSSSKNRNINLYEAI